MYQVFIYPSELFLSLTCYKFYVNCRHKICLMLQCDQNVELLDKFYSRTTFSVMTYIHTIMINFPGIF